MAPELHPDVWRGLEKFEITNCTTLNPNNIYSMKYALKSLPGLAGIGVPHGDGDGPRTPARCLGRVRKKLKMPVLPFLTTSLLWNML